MSTRSVIARPSGEGFEGRYHHWDGYPEGVGETLFRLRNGQFGGDTEAMLKLLLDDHPAGWSTINGKDMTRPAGFQHDSGSAVPCIAIVRGKPCGKSQNQHLCQYSPKSRKHATQYPCGGGTYANHLGHPFEEDPAIARDLALNPECYCHGQRAEEGNLVTAENASGMGCEYAYVIEGSRMLVMSSYHEDGGKAIGMFGMGDPEASWRIIGDVDLDGPEPNWAAMTASDEAEVA